MREARLAALLRRGASGADPTAELHLAMPFEPFSPPLHLLVS
jgi:hypothetical protein